ncbi:MAG: aldehyde ferredoxin oxidoreductase family protein [Promethearchaeota archaeon]
MLKNNDYSNLDKSISIWGKILHIDMSKLAFYEEKIDYKIYRKLIGGKGLGIYLLFRIPPKCDPLSEKNDLIFVTGPLNGTLAPCSSKFGVVTKSPKTNAFLDSYSSGKFGSMIKFAGYDAIVFHGKATEQQIVTINNNKVEFYSASQNDVIGLSPLETEYKLKKKFGYKYECASIGLAGEKVVPIAGIFTNQRCCGRGGAGAVMGSKKIKAILIKGSNPIPVNNYSEFVKAAWTARRYIRSSEITVRALPTYGTANIVNTVNEFYCLPTKNFSSGHFEDADNISGYSWRKNYWIIKNQKGKIQSNDIACYSCPISCSKIAFLQNSNLKIEESISKLDNKIVIDGPEYETIFALGSNIGNSDSETLLTANYLCDYYGIDTISCGVIIGFLMELFEKGLIKKEDVGGIELKWGDPNAIFSLIRAIGKAEGYGREIGYGVNRIAENIYNKNKINEVKNIAMHVKGLELPGYDPRRARGMGLGYAIGDRGACHLHSFTASVEVLGNWGGADPYELGDTKLELFLNLQADSCLIDSAILCFFTLNGIQAKEVLAMLNAAVGKGFFVDEGADLVKNHAKRVLALTRLFNIREGFSKEDDTLPLRIINEAHKEGPAKNVIFDNFEQARNKYYSLMGWDENGIPKKTLLKELKIDSLINQI